LFANTVSREEEIFPDTVNAAVKMKQAYKFILAVQSRR
jgi:hypothetical protein